MSAEIQSTLLGLCLLVPIGGTGGTRLRRFIQTHPPRVWEDMLVPSPETLSNSGTSEPLNLSSQTPCLPMPDPSLHFQTHVRQLPLLMDRPRMIDACLSPMQRSLPRVLCATFGRAPVHLRGAYRIKMLLLHMCRKSRPPSSTPTTIMVTRTWRWHSNRSNSNKPPYPPIQLPACSSHPRRRLHPIRDLRSFVFRISWRSASEERR